MSTTYESVGNALHGAPKENIPLSIPCVGPEEEALLRDCVATNFISTVGPYVDAFERRLADYAGVSHAVAVASGTAALHTALLCAGVKPNDEVLVSTLTFIAPANAIRYVGAHPVFIDAEPRYWQMDVELSAAFLNVCCDWRGGELINRATGRRVSAILPVHVLGHPADIAPLVELAQKYNLRLIEDAAEALGAKYRGESVGKAADVACLSFNGNKIVTTGGGGAILTNNDVLADQARYITTQAKDDSLAYVHGSVGYNYRLTNLQAAVGCAQLDKLEQFVASRRAHAEYYCQALSDWPCTVWRESPNAFATHWLSAIELSGRGETALDLAHRLKTRGIETRPLWQPLHRSPAHRGAQAVLSGVADRLADSVLCLPSSPQLTAEKRAYVVQELRRETLARAA